MTITPREFKAAQAVLGVRTNVRGTPYFVSRDAPENVWDVVLSQGSRSNVPTLGEVKELIEDLRPQILFLCGTAGALCDDVENAEGKLELVPRENLKLGDVVIADYVSYVDFVKITDKGVFHRQYAFDHPSIWLQKTAVAGLIHNFDLQRAISETPPEPCSPKIVAGAIVAGEKIMGGVENMIQTGLLKPFDKAVAVEMESVGMARAVYESRTSFWYNPRYAVVRGISDVVGVPGNSELRDQWTDFAAHAAAVVVKEFVERIPMEQSKAGTGNVRNRLRLALNYMRQNLQD